MPWHRPVRRLDSESNQDVVRSLNDSVYKSEIYETIVTVLAENYEVNQCPSGPWDNANGKPDIYAQSPSNSIILGS